MKFKQQPSNAKKKENKKEHTKINVENLSSGRKLHKLALWNQWRINGELTISHKLTLSPKTLEKMRRQV